jgi:hypothetical protein
VKATIDVPDALYRRVKARSAIEGRSIRDVTVELFERWLAEAPGPTDALDETDRPTATAAWLQRWSAIGRRIATKAPSDRTTREILDSDRGR